MSAQAYLDKAAAEPGAQKTASGLIYRELKPGTRIPAYDSSKAALARI